MSSHDSLRMAALVAWCALASLACGGSTSHESPDASVDDAGSQGLVVSCGGSQCRIANGEACCAPAGTSAPTCSASCTASDTLRCDGPEDCPGQICCSQFLPNGFSEAACRDTCPNGNGLNLCHGDTDCTTASAPGASKCCPLNARVYPGVGVCDAPSGTFCTQ